MNQVRENLDAVCRTAFQHFGTDRQLNKTQEECAELIAAISHFRENRDGSMEELREELADVKIVVRQLELSFGASEIAEIEQKKLRRLKDMIRDDRTKAGQDTKIIGQRQI